MYEEELKVCMWVFHGILPDKLLKDKFRIPRWLSCERVSGISPEMLFSDKSRAFNMFNWPISCGIVPVKLFLERFKSKRPSRLEIS